MLLLAALLLGQAGPDPMERLVGYCWRGELKPGEFDTHCFSRTQDGVRDHHEVTIGGRTVYWGESDFRREGRTDGIAFAYRNANGPVSSGRATVTADGIDFGSVRWIWDGADAYAMLREGVRTRFTRIGPAPPRPR